MIKLSIIWAWSFEAGIAPSAYSPSKNLKYVYSALNPSVLA